MRSSIFIAAIVLLSLACASTPELGVPSRTAPKQLIGNFVDDYDNQFEISDREWKQLPSGIYLVEEWNVRDSFLIARSENPRGNGKWARIDWIKLSGMDPYTWGFCITAWGKESPEEAKNNEAPNRASPRDGCNGWPFSRMRAAPSH